MDEMVGERMLSKTNIDSAYYNKGSETDDRQWIFITCGEIVDESVVAGRVTSVAGKI